MQNGRTWGNRPGIGGQWGAGAGDYPGRGPGRGSNAPGIGGGGQFGGQIGGGIVNDTPRRIMSENPAGFQSRFYRMTRAAQ